MPLNCLCLAVLSHVGHCSPAGPSQCVVSTCVCVCVCVCSCAELCVCLVIVCVCVVFCVCVCVCVCVCMYVCVYMCACVCVFFIKEEDLTIEEEVGCFHWARVLLFSVISE